MQVNAPVPTFTGEVAGVAFSRGVGDVDPGDQPALAYFRRHGYTVEPAQPDTEPDTEPDAGAEPDTEPDTEPAPEGAEAKPGTRRTRKTQ